MILRTQCMVAKCNVMMEGEKECTSVSLYLHSESELAILQVKIAKTNHYHMMHFKNYLL